MPLHIKGLVVIIFLIIRLSMKDFGNKLFSMIFL